MTRDEQWLKKICVHCKKIIYKRDAIGLPKGKRWRCEFCDGKRKHIKEDEND